MSVVVRGAQGSRHKALVAALGAEGWNVPGTSRVTFRVALAHALRESLRWNGWDIGPRCCPATNHWKRCGNEECGDCFEYEYLDEMIRGVPDAWKVDVVSDGGPRVWVQVSVAEVNVGHHAEFEKWASLWAYLDDEFEGPVEFHYVIVDRNGVRSEPWARLHGLSLAVASMRGVEAGFAVQDDLERGGRAATIAELGGFA